jgi:hypothetical protein
MATPVNKTASDFLSALSDYLIMRPGPFNAIEIGNIEKSWFDGFDETKGFRRRREPPIKRFIGRTLPGFAVYDQILPQIHSKK